MSGDLRPGCAARPATGTPPEPGLELLEAAISYALDGATLFTPQLLSHPTPCPAWDLEMLLDHLGDSIEVLHEALADGGAGPRTAQAHTGPPSDCWAPAPPGRPGPWSH